MIRALRQMAHDGPRHTGVYGFGGRRTRRVYMIGGAEPTLLVDRDVWAQLADRYAAEHPGLFGPLFGTPVRILDPVDGERGRP